VIEFKREGDTIVCELQTNIVPDGEPENVFCYRLECKESGEFVAEVVLRFVRAEFGKWAQSVRKEEYERGFKAGYRAAKGAKR